MTASNVFAALLGLAIFGKTIHFLIVKRQDNLDEDPKSEHVNEVLFFPDSAHPCPKLIKGIASSPRGARKILCDNMSCRKLHNRPNERSSSMIRFLEYLCSAKQSVDLCIYLFTQKSLGDVLYDLHKTGHVTIRIITDASEDDAGSTQIERLSSNGIAVKSNRRGTGALMHHKFVIIDGKILLSGSFNWTNKAIVNNYEAVQVTSEPKLVRPFREQFEQMWANFRPHYANRAQ